MKFNTPVRQSGRATQPFARLCMNVYVSLLSPWLVLPLLFVAGCTPAQRALPAPQPVAAAVEEAAPGEVYRRVRDASVEVLVAGRMEGSGWFADPQGYIVTAAHIIVANPDALIEVISPTVGRLPVQTVALDIGHDLALLRVDEWASQRHGPFTALPIAASTPAIGEKVFLFGTPMFRHGVALHGRVARREPSYEFLPRYDEYVRVYNVRGVAPHGSSGGCWINQQGQVVGNQSGFMIHSNAQTGLVFVAPPDAVEHLVRTRRTVGTPTLHMAVNELWERPVEFIERFPRGLEGAVPAVLLDDGAARAAGLTRNMLITAVDGKAIRYRDDFIAAVRSRQAGDVLRLTLFDAGADVPRDVHVTVRERRGLSP